MDISTISLKFPLELSLPRYAPWVGPFVPSTGLKLGETGNSQKPETARLGDKSLSLTQQILIGQHTHSDFVKYLPKSCNHFDCILKIWIKRKIAWILNHHQEGDYHQDDYQGKEKVLTTLIADKSLATEVSIEGKLPLFDTGIVPVRRSLGGDIF